MDRTMGYGLMVVGLLMGVATITEATVTNALSPRSLVAAAHQAALSLNSYTCRLTSITRHRGANGRYQAEKKNVLNHTFRKPGEVRLEWLEPRRKRGQLAVYDGNTLRAAPTWLPFAVSVRPDSPTGMDDFHHPVYRSDLASLMSIVLQDLPKVTEEAYEGQVAVGQRTAHRVVLQTVDKRVVLDIDTEHNLPLAIEQYDRTSGLLFDGGYFEDLTLNPSLADSLFDL
ncbi:MAG: hypothetical protein ACE5KY_00335 [Candidatus Tectimicrobiota bacterium]